MTTSGRLSEMSTMSGGSQRAVGSVELVPGLERTLIRLCGEVDASLNADLAGACVEAARRGVPTDVDSRGTTFVDSTVIAAIAHLSRRLPAGVTVIDPPEHVRFLLQVSEVADLVTITEPEPLAATVRTLEVPDLAAAVVEGLSSPAVPELPRGPEGTGEPITPAVDRV